MWFRIRENNSVALSHNVGTRLLTRTADSKITEYEMIDTKNSSTAYVVM